MNAKFFFLILLTIFINHIEAQAKHVVFNKRTLSGKISDQHIEKINEILKKYDWPSSVDLISNTTGKMESRKVYNTYRSLWGSKKYAGTTWLENEISKISPALGVMWVPATLWDLFMLNQIYLRYPEGIYGLDHKELQLLSDRFLTQLKELGLLSKTKLPNWDNQADLKTLYSVLIKGFSQPVEENYIIDKKIVESLKKEAQFIDQDNSILIEATKAENRAEITNHALLFRATSGIKIFDNSSDNFENLALDFPLPSPDGASRTVEAALKNLPLVLNKTKPYEILDFSYSYGLLNGCTYDPGICTFYYVRSRANQFLYTVSLSKKFLLTRAKQLFYLPQFDPTTLVVGESILAHPRSRRLGELRWTDRFLGGEVFLVDYYSPLNHKLVVGSKSQREYLSFALELQSILSKNIDIISFGSTIINSENNNIKSAVLRNNKNASLMLEDHIEKALQNDFKKLSAPDPGLAP